MITFDIITIFPEILDSYFKESLLKRAQEKRLLKIRVHNLRDWATNNVALRGAQGNSSAHRRIDDKPFGGGLGMVLKVEPLWRAVSTLKLKVKNEKRKIILFTPRGKKFTQKKAHEYAKLKQIIMVCGRYEGVDERVAKYIADEQISIGDYVLMGGELPAMIVVETVSRLIPGVIGKDEFLKERVKGAGFVEYPQYTRPEVFSAQGETSPLRGGEGWKAPKVLLSGDHKKIAEWKQKHGKIIA